MDPLRNPKDPLRKSGPEAERELFRAFGRAANDYPTEAVVGAAMNVLVNAVRQEQATRTGAREKFDELVARARTLLLEQHYDILGRRRSVFPFHQTIEVPLIAIKKGR